MKCLWLIPFIKWNLLYLFVSYTISTVKTIPLKTNMVSCTVLFQTWKHLYFSLKHAYCGQVYLSLFYLLQVLNCIALVLQLFCMWMVTWLEADVGFPCITYCLFHTLYTWEVLWWIFQKLSQFFSVWNGFSCRTDYKTWGSVNYSCDELLSITSSLVCNLMKAENIKHI